MENKDIILQVDEETANIMEDISEQLFDETDTRFDEVIEQLKSLSKLNDVSAEHVTEVKTKSEQIISSTKDILIILQELVKGEVNASDTCNEILNCLKESKEEFKENDSKLLLLETSNSEQAREILVKLNDVKESMDTISTSIKDIAEQQNIICKKHSELEKDIKYLKTPFYKRWFAKGED